MKEVDSLPRDSKYPIFEVSGSRNHTFNPAYTLAHILCLGHKAAICLVRVVGVVDLKGWGRVAHWNGSNSDVEICWEGQGI